MEILDRQPSRRSVLKALAAGGAYLAGGGLLEACGVTTTTTTAKKRGGTLRVGASDGGIGDSVDVSFGDSYYANAMRTRSLYDTLVYPDHNFKTQPWLAEEITTSADLVDLTIRIRQGVTFHNGKTLTADDVVFSLQRATDPKNPGGTSTQVPSLKPAGVTKVDDRTVQLHLTGPDVSVIDGLRDQSFGIVPVGYDPKNPIGTGPFKFQSFTPGQQSVFVRNENYWVTGQPYLDQLNIVALADPTARVDALLSGQVDVLDRLKLNQIALVQSNPKLRVLSSRSGNFVAVFMRMDQPPFTDVRVRQAMRLIADRPQLIQQVFSGHGQLGNDIWAVYDPCYPKLPQRHQDLEQAKSLLAAAGQSNLSLTLATADAGSGFLDAAQVFAEQAKGAGVAVNINEIAVSDLYGPAYGSRLFTQDSWPNQPIFSYYDPAFLPGGPYNIGHFFDAEFNSLAQQARSQPDTVKRCELLAQCMEIEYERGNTIVWGFGDQATAYSSTFTGFVNDPSGWTPNGGSFREIHLA